MRRPDVSRTELAVGLGLVAGTALLGLAVRALDRLEREALAAHRQRR